MRLLALGAAVLLAVSPGGVSPRTTFAAAGRAALATLLRTYEGGPGLWRLCDAADCPTGNVDWGADALTYDLWLRWSAAHDASILPRMRALEATALSWAAECRLGSCGGWSDVPEWDAIADVREYQVTGDPGALAKARAAYAFVAGSDAFALGACPEVDFQQPGGGSNHLKTLETDANAIKAALLLHQATGDDRYLRDAVRLYGAVRRWFLDPAVPLYSVYVFDDGVRCTQLPHRFFASVNGDMIGNGAALARATGDHVYLRQAEATAAAVATRLADPAGVFADLQAENDIVEPLVEGMATLAVDDRFTLARDWLLRNAAAALSARTADGSYGRFFDGPPPLGTVTAWQTNGGLALAIVASALDPAGTARTDGWVGAVRVARSAGPTATIRFTGSAIALLGTLGESCCESGHARILIDGRPTFDRSGIWQEKSSSGRRIPETILLAWRWPTAGVHELAFLPGIANPKEGGSFLHVRGFLRLR